MPARDDIHAEFVARFHLGDRPSPATDEQIDGIGTELATTIPSAYRRFMTRHGSVYTPGILDAVVDRQLDHPDVQNILTPDEAIEGTKAYWSAGMPSDVIGVASDCMGNMIGFRRQTGAVDDAPVVFFDHDFVEVSDLADSFDAFLQWYLDNIDGR
jgi:hypothetical protein